MSYCVLCNKHYDSFPFNIYILYIYTHTQINRYLNLLSGMTYFILFTVTHRFYNMYLNHFPDVYYEFAYLCVQGHTSGSQKHLLEEGRVGRNLALYLCTKNKPCSTDLLRIEMSGPPASGEVYSCHGFLPVDFFIQSNHLISDTSRSAVLFPPGKKTLCR